MTRPLVTEGSVRNSLRFSGQLRRYHTWPVLKQQTLAEHCWGVVEIYRRLFGWPDGHVVEHILFHDAGEMMTGDIPFQGKRDHPELKDITNVIEEMHRTKLVGIMEPLSIEEYGRFKFSDMAELCEFAQQELQQGNGFALPILENGLKALSLMLGRDYIIQENRAAWASDTCIMWIDQIKHWRNEWVK